MKRILLVFALAVLPLAVQSCQDKYFDQIDRLKETAEELAEVCVQANINLKSISRLVSAIQSKDLITGISDVKVEDKVVGYKINFVTTPSVTIYNGDNGATPYVGMKMDGGMLYWTIQYGIEGTVNWLLDSSGNKVPAVGSVPSLKVSDGDWYCSVDGGEWVKLGPSTGTSADTMFKKIDSSDPYFVTIVLSDGTSLKIPKKEAYDDLIDTILMINSNVEAQRILLDQAKADRQCISKMEPVLDGVDTIGFSIELSGGKKFTVYDWHGSIVPCVRVEQDPADGKYYWCVQFGDDPYEWILSKDGDRIVADNGQFEAPQVGTELKDGNWFWTVSYGDTTYFVKNAHGEEIAASGRCLAADSLQRRWFKAFKVTDETVQIVFNDANGTVVTLPMMYTITLLSPTLVSDTLKVHAPDAVQISYITAGVTAKDVVVVADGGLKCTVDKSAGKINVYSESSFDEGNMLIVFTFGTANSANTRMKSLKVVKY